MGLRRGLDKLFGAGEFVSAKKTVDQLDEKKKLTGRDKKNRGAAEEILQERRTFLKQALAATAVVAVGSVLGYSNKEKLGCGPQEQPQDAPQHTSGGNTEYPTHHMPDNRSEYNVSGAEMRRIVDNGFAKAFKNIPSDPRKVQGKELYPLSAIKAFKKWCILCT